MGTMSAHILAVVCCGCPLWALANDVHTTKEEVTKIRKNFERKGFQ